MKISDIKKRLKKYLKTAFKITVVLHIILFLFILAAGLYLKNNNPSTTSLMLYRTLFCNHDVKQSQFIPLKEIPRAIPKMVISTEDYKFRDHFGIDLEAMKRAFIINRKVGYRMFGASTITMQLSRTLFLFPKKLLLRKYIEIFIALEIDMILSKDRLLELYLNYAEWGKGIFGIKAAAQHYYKKTIDKLTIDETTRLITILANPIDYGPNSFKNKKFLAYRYFIIKFRYYTYQKFHGLK